MTSASPPKTCLPLLLPNSILEAPARYTLALAPLVTLTKPGAQATLQRQLDAIDHHSRLRVHLDDAGRALAVARACLTGLHRPTSPSKPALPPTTTSATRAR